MLFPSYSGLFSSGKPKVSHCLPSPGASTFTACYLVETQLHEQDIWLACFQPAFAWHDFHGHTVIYQLVTQNLIWYSFISDLIWRTQEETLSRLGVL